MFSHITIPTLPTSTRILASTTRPPASPQPATAVALARVLHYKVLLILLAVLTALASFYVSVAGTTHAAGLSFTFVRGYTVQQGWLCYGWNSGVYHCTQHWRRDAAGHAISDNPRFVPNGQAADGTVTHPVAPTTGSSGSGPAGSAPSGTGVVTSGQPCSGGTLFPGQISQWTVPQGCYSQIFSPNPANYPSRPSWGWCNWWPEALHPGDAGYSALHGAVDGAPHSGDVVHFNAGVQGAGGAGHYAQVVAARSDGWLLITEMNFYWRGGGFGRVDYRFVHTGAGVWYSRA